MYSREQQSSFLFLLSREDLWCLRIPSTLNVSRPKPRLRLRQVRDLTSPMFSFEDQIVIIEEGNVVHAYHMGTGEVLDPTRASPHSYDLQCSLWDVMDGRHYPCYCELPKWGMPSKDDWPVSETTLRDGWVKDPEGKHRLWILPEWRTIVSCWDMDEPCGGSSWLPKITTLRLECKNGTVIIMF